MCFALPKKVKSQKNGLIETCDGKIAKSGSLVLKNGDYVTIYGNMVVEKISKKKAEIAQKILNY